MMSYSRIDNSINIKHVEPLNGGRPGQIFKAGDTVFRPGATWTPTVHRFLDWLRTRGFFHGPQAIGIDDDGHERVSYVSGWVCEDLRDESVGAESVLVSAAQLLRAFHDASAGFLETDPDTKIWMLPAVRPMELICHGDFAPYNVAVANGQAVGLIDFDTAHPAPRLWDLAYALYRWAPLSAPESAPNPLVPFDIDTRLHRARLFCTAYGATPEDRKRLPGLLCSRLQALVDFMLAAARAGDLQYAEDVELGHVQAYLRDIQYIERSGRSLSAALA